MDSTPANKKVYGYCRVSSIGQTRDGVSIDRQRDKIIAYCKSRGTDQMLEVIIDESISGFKTNRPGFQRLLSECKAGIVSEIIVYDLSRLSRSVRDTLAFIDEIVKKLNIGFVSLQQNIDTNTPMGMAFISLTSVFNQLYRDEISWKTKVALGHKKFKGERYSGQLPYGFDEVDGKLTANKDEQALIAIIQELRNASMSLREICLYLEQHGMKTKTGLVKWNAKTIRDLLRRGVTLPP